MNVKDPLHARLQDLIPDQGQAAGGGCGPCRTAVTGVQDTRDLVRRLRSPSHFHQGSRNDTDHIVKKAASSDADDDLPRHAGGGTDGIRTGTGIRTAVRNVLRVCQCDVRTCSAISEPGSVMSELSVRFQSLSV